MEPNLAPSPIFSAEKYLLLGTSFADVMSVYKTSCLVVVNCDFASCSDFHSCLCSCSWFRCCCYSLVCVHPLLLISLLFLILGSSSSSLCPSVEKAASLLSSVETSNVCPPKIAEKLLEREVLSLRRKTDCTKSGHFLHSFHCFSCGFIVLRSPWKDQYE